MKKKIIPVAIGIVILAVVFTRTTFDFDQAKERMNATEIDYLENALFKIKPDMSQGDLERLLGTPYRSIAGVTEWKAPVFPGRVRVYFSEGGKKVKSVSWRKIGWFDVKFKPWERMS